MKDHRGVPRGLARSLFLASALLAGAAQAQDSVEVYQEYDRKIRAAEQVDPLDDGLFGDSISLFNGQTEFSNVDIDLPGNNALPVQLRRRLPVAPRNGGVLVEDYAGMGDWSIDVPYLVGTFSAVYGWDRVVQGSHARRCSEGVHLPTVPGGYRVQDVFQGVSLHIPGQGDRELLANDTGTPARDDPVVRRWTTRDFASIDCIPLPGAEAWQEGFVVQATDGLRYTFDRVTTRNAGRLKRPWINGLAQTTARSRIHLLASRVEDRFGNHVSFHYNAHGHPVRIEASDGRVITMSYTDGRLDAATAFGRTWRYAYAPPGPGYGATARLLQVTRPDASRWSYAYVGDMQIDYPAWDGNDGPGCRGAPPEEKAFGLVVSHPSGAVGDFRFRHGRFYRSGVHASACQPIQLGEGRVSHALLRTNFHDVLAIVSKTIVGPGLPPGLQWRYLDGGTRYPLWGSTNVPTDAVCTTCPTEKHVSVLQPDGTTLRHRFGVQFGLNEGRLLGTATLDARGVVVRTESHDYLAESEAAGQVFADRYGTMYGGDDPSSTRIRPQLRTTISVKGDGSEAWDHFVSETPRGCSASRPAAYCFDAFARKLRSTRRSVLADGHAYSRTDTTAYRDDRRRWLLGAVASVRNEDSGVVTSSATYDPVTGMPLQVHAFGKLQQTLRYHLAPGPEAGTVSSLSDGRDGPGLDTTIVLSGWKRGIPQHIAYPPTPDQAAGASERATVDDLGRITATVDANGFETRYQYDAMGRHTRTDFPAGDATQWLPVVSTFTQVGGAEYGIGPSHWRQTTSTGDARTVTHFDAFWRPLVVETYDQGDPAGTRSVRVSRYDLGGRKAFDAYPLRSLVRYTDPLPGTTTSHDALGRVVGVEQTAEAGVAARTVTRYLAGLTTEITSPRQQVTLTRHMAYDQPGQDWPVRIDHPEQAITEISRDVHGAPLELVRRNATGTVSSTRRYVYGAHHELCKRIEPESGATVTAHDAGNNVAWTAAGLALPSTMSCDHGAVPEAVKVHRQHDARNRMTHLAFPDSRGDQAWRYTPDGQPWQVRTVNVPGRDDTVNTYAYDRRRNLVSESVAQGTWYSFSIGYAYDGNGSLAAQSYPSGHSVQFAPNALGQPTSVRSASAGAVYANAVSYHPNGALRQFTYGNGIVHTMAQNARQLPARSTDAGVVDLEFGYDANGNVDFVGDRLLGTAGHRSMDYDGLDRLSHAASAAFGGDHHHRFAYDALDNLTHWSLGAGGKDYRYNYHPASHQLLSISDGVGGPAIEGFAFDPQGNLANKSGRLFDFDFGNRLREVASGGIALERYRYDALGRRVLANQMATGIIFSQYARGGELLYQEDTRPAEYRTTDFIYLAGSLIARHDRAPTGAATVTYQHTDALGSPIATTNAAGSVTTRMKYEPFGKVIGAARDGPGYTGHVLDAGTGLNYMQQRYYDPDIGRFLSVDPVTANPRTGANFNRYWYGNNNPYKFIDPDGRLGCTGTRIQSVCDSGGVAALRTSARSPLDTGGPVKSEKSIAGEGNITNGSIGYTTPTGKGVRGCDGYGCGHDGARRDGGRRSHAGNDYIAEPGQPVASPTDGSVVRSSNPYRNDPSYTGLLIRGFDGNTLQLWYLTPSPGIVGDAVVQGQAIGTAQDLRHKYGPGMTNHIHLRITGPGGSNINPSKLIPDP